MKLNLLIDVSPFAYEAVHRLCGYKGKNLKADRFGKFLQTEDEKERFLAVMDEKIKEVVDAIPSSTYRVFFVFDPKSGEASWRYKIFGDYKGTRKDKVKAYDAGELKICFERYKKFLLGNSFNVVQVPHMEADDMIGFISTYPHVDEDHLVLSPDSDLKQLVKASDSSNVFFYDKVKQEVIVHEGFNINKIIGGEAPATAGDFSFNGLFDDDNVADDKIKDFFRAHKKINPQELLITKIISGDKSDNIPPGITYLRGTQTYGITEDRMKKTWPRMEGATVDWEYIKNTVMVELNEGLKTKKVSDYFPNKEDHKATFDLNKKLILLGTYEEASEEIKLMVKKLFWDDITMNFEQDRFVSTSMFERSGQSW